MKKERINEEFRSYVRSLGCLISNHECRGQIHAHHFKHKSAGWGDEGNLIPLCHNHHTGNQGIHLIGKNTFMEKYGLQLEALADSIYHAFLSRENLQDGN